MGIFNEIIGHESLTEREQSIRTFLIQYPEKLYNMTAHDLGEATYSSAAAVTRFCKKLGCRGYQDFRIQFLQDYREQRGDSSGRNDTGQIIDIGTDMPVLLREAVIYRQAVEKVIKENSPERINKAFDMIHAAGCLDFYAFDLNAHCAAYAVYQFMQCGKMAGVYVEPSLQIRSALEKRPGHLAVLISFTGNNTRMIDLAGILHANGTKTLCFVGNIASSLASLADHVLIVPTGEKSKGMLREENVTLFTTAFKYLADVLIALEYEKNRERLREDYARLQKMANNKIWQFDMSSKDMEMPD